MKLAIPCLVSVLLLSGCARPVSIPPSEDDESVAEVEPEREQSLMSLPDFHANPREFRCAPYIRAIVRLQRMGQEAAIKTLKELAREERASEGCRVIVLSRMLFTKKAGSEFRRPMLGASHFLGGSDYPDWPLEPIEVIDGVPFLIVWGYSLSGRAESSEQYLAECIAECEWNRVPFAPKTKAEKAKTLEKILSSAKWKEPLSEHEKAFLAEQVK